MLIQIELYGRLREAGLGDKVEIDVAEGLSAGEILAALARRLGENGDLLAGAALATESEVLSPSAPAPAGARLAVLPPVCGG